MYEELNRAINIIIQATYGTPIDEDQQRPFHAVLPFLDWFLKKNKENWDDFIKFRYQVMILRAISYLDGVGKKMESKGE